MFRTAKASESWEQVPTLWTGWLTAELFLHPGPSAAGTPVVAGSALVSLELTVRRDIVAVWIDTRTLAVVDRDLLRAWLRAPAETFPVDDLEFIMIGRHLCLRIDGYGPYVIGANAVRQLVELL